MGADGGNVVLHEGQELLACGGFVGDSTDLAPDDGVMGHDELAAFLRSFPNDRGRDIQGHQNLGNCPVPPAHQESRIVKVCLIPEGGLPIQYVINLSYRCHALHSFSIA